MLHPYRHVLSRLLLWANSSPPLTTRREFYDLKRRILKRHGVIAGQLLQEITRECWGYYGRDCGPKCGKCGGTGIYSRKWVYLGKWTMSGLSFLVPELTDYPPPDARRAVDIHGRVEHMDYGLLSGEAGLWLYLLTGEFRLFWRELSSHHYCRPGWWPLLNVQKLCRKAGEARRGRIENYDRESVPF